jgi:hypothetical protein
MKFGIDYFPDAQRTGSGAGSTYIRDTFGEVYPSFQTNFGMMEKARARRSIELFARHVMPRFR